MKGKILLLPLGLIAVANVNAQWAEPVTTNWNYNFSSGTTGTFSTTSTLNLSSDAGGFLPPPPSGTAMLFIASDTAATFSLNAPANTLTVIAPTTSNNKFTAYGISGATAVASSTFGITLDSTSGSTLTNNLAYVWSIGNSDHAGVPYISKNAVNNASTAYQSIFTAIRILYNSTKSQYAIGYRNTTTSTTSTYTTLGGGVLFGAIHYIVHVFCNNSTASHDYTGPDGNTYTVAPGSFQLWTTNTATSENTRYHITGNVYDIPRSVETFSTTGDESMLDDTPLNAFAFQSSTNSNGVGYEVIDGGINVSYIGTPLPVSFVSSSFTAKLVNQSVQLNWETASEQNNAWFEILHSSDARTYESIGKVPGHQTTSLQHAYSFIDSKPFQGKNFYKLKQVDLDGKATFNSDVITIDAGKLREAMTVYLNGENLQINANASRSGNGTLQVFSAGGQQLINRPIQLNKGENYFTTDVSVLHGGVYVAVVRMDDSEQSVQFVK